MDLLNKTLHGDCLELLPLVPSGSVDMVLCDLPYGMTQNKWDSVIDLTRLWVEYKRVLRANGAVVLTACQPFAAALVSSNYSWFKYEWIWRKNNATGHLNAHKQPMREHENVLVFGDGKIQYVPQGLIPHNKVTRSGRGSSNFGKHGKEWFQSFTNYPRTILEFSYDTNKLHPTQKPVALFEYLIRTYTNEGDLVLDNCCGSGTTGVACQNTGRNFIQMELDPKYCEIVYKRLDENANKTGVNIPVPVDDTELGRSDDVRIRGELVESCLLGSGGSADVLRNVREVS